MMRSLWTASTGMVAMQMQIDTMSNNLANVNTVGFKRNSAAFEDQFYEVARRPGSNSQGDNRVPAGVQLGTGVRLVSTHKQFTDGSMQNTSQQLDVAIVGNGFLQVLLSNGETAYTRAGQLQVDNEGRLVNANGLVVQPEITFPAETKSVSISATGRVSATVGTESTPQELGALQLASFVNPAGLVAQGENLYLVSQASGDAVLGEPGEAGFGTLRQFALESSNVQAVEEMVDMISAQRSYEMNTKVLSAADDMMRNLAQAS